MLFGYYEVSRHLPIGILFALIFYFLRAAIDRRKGALIEVAAVALPVVLAAGIVYLLVEDHKGVEDEFAITFSPVAEAIFISLPAFVAFRLFERQALGEKLMLADLFRITTVAALVAFALTSFTITPFAIVPACCLMAFIGSECARKSSNPGTALATAFICSFISLIVLCVWAQLRLTYYNRQAILEGVAMISVILPQIVVRSAIEKLIHRSHFFPRIAAKLTSLRQAIGDPKELIYYRTVFDLWHFDDNVCYLNHGSFGAVPLVLRNDQRRLRDACESEPMDFLVRKLERLWFDARFKLAVWLGTQPENIAFCENATAGMNEIASWFPLSEGDEVLMNDHEYGAVRRIWKRRCEAVGAKLVEVTLPLPLTDPQQITDSILAGCNERTRLVILSHITSPTAIILPVEKICPLLRARGIASCVDGPHALLQETFKLYSLQCDFYTASCHKWLCAPIGSGFVYVDPRWHSQFKPARLSWGRLNPAKPEKWSDELLWTGTRDYSAYLTVPYAIEFFSKFEREKLDARNHELACYARRRLSELPGAEPVTPEGRKWFGWMVGVWLPSDYTAYDTLQKRLWERYKIEVPIVHFAGRYLVRVSCHLYISTHDIDTLVRCLQQELQPGS